MENIQNTIKEYFSYCVYEKNLSSKTLKAYSIDLTQFVGFLNNASSIKCVEEIDKVIVRGYLQFISHYKPKSIKRKIAALKTFLNFLEFDDRITVNPFRKLRINIKQVKELPKVMSLKEVEKIMNSVYNDMYNEQNLLTYAYKEKVRNVAVIELLFATGVRVAELSGIRKENIDLTEGFIRVLGKGSKERVIQFSNKGTLNILKKYGNLFKSEIDTSGNFFFVNRFGKRLSEQSIRYLVKEHASRSGIKRNITPHVFRHSFATLLLEENVDIKYIQNMLGHSSIMTTQIYTHVNNEKQKQILMAFHPRRNLVVKRKISSAT